MNIITLKRVEYRLPLLGYIFLIIILNYSSLNSLEISPSESWSQVAEKYVVIAQTIPKEVFTTDSLKRWEKYKPLHVCTDSFSALIPGFFVIITSVHETNHDAEQQSRQLSKAGIDNYVRYTGRFISSKIPTPEQALSIAKKMYPQEWGKTANVPLKLRGKIFPFVLLHEKLPDLPQEQIEPENMRGFTRALLFLGMEPFEIKNHKFITPAGEMERPFINCDSCITYTLSPQDTSPIIIAQHCNELNIQITRFLVFGETNLHDPAMGSATWTNSALPTSLHERFVPDSLNDKLGGLPLRRGDGKTIVDGWEGQLNSEDFLLQDKATYKTRDFQVIWNGQHLIRNNGPWKLLQ